MHVFIHLRAPLIASPHLVNIGTNKRVERNTEMISA